MKTLRIKALWVMIAVIAVCLTACSKEEPQPPVDPNQQENPNDPTNPDEPQEPDEPQTPDNPDGLNPEYWEDENPHGFYFDIDSLELILTDDGFMIWEHWENSHQTFRDYIVMEKRFGYPSKERKSTEKGSVVYGPLNKSSLHITGKRATPWNHIEQYVKMWSTVGICPNSKFSTFPQLTNLKKGDAQRFGFYLWDNLVKVDIISHKYFSKKIPAGASMCGNYSGLESDFTRDNPVGMFLKNVTGEWVFDRVLFGGALVGGDPQQAIFLGSSEVVRYPNSGSGLWLIGYPDEPGDYPMTLRMEFESGRVFTKDFKIRFVNEE